MSKNIIIASCNHPQHLVIKENGNITNRYEKMCLGHEIHLTRFLIIDMLVQNRISKDDIIVTLKDRRFLYSKIFNNCITEEEYWSIDRNGYNIINLTQVTCADIPVQEWSILQYFNHQTLKRFYTPTFNAFLNRIDYCEIKYRGKDYVVIHHRYTCDINLLIKTINTINNKMNVNIIIFNNNINFLKNALLNFDNLIFIDNLQLYASYLNNSKCKLFISEWSGGGQLSQYCYDGKIMYYFNHYPTKGYVGQEKEFARLSMETDMYQHFDFKHSRNIDINLFNTLDEILELL
jgi:hypothetical protein